MDALAQKIQRIANVWSAFGVVALVGIGLAIIVHPIFFGLLLVYPFTPFLFVMGKLPFVIVMVAVAVIFLAVGEGIRKRETWSRFGAIGLSILAALYFVSLILGLWSRYVKFHDLRFLWLLPPAAMWLALTIPAIFFLLNNEVGKQFVKTPDYPLSSQGDGATELGTSGE